MSARANSSRALGVPSDEALFDAGWAKHFDPARRAYYYYPVDGSGGPQWENPLEGASFQMSVINSVIEEGSSSEYDDDDEDDESGDDSSDDDSDDSSYTSSSSSRAPSIVSPEDQKSNERSRTSLMQQSYSKNSSQSYSQHSSQSHGLMGNQSGTSMSLHDLRHKSVAAGGTSGHLMHESSYGSSYSEELVETGIPSDEDLFDAGWAKQFDPGRGAFYFYPIDGSSAPQWENPIQGQKFQMSMAPDAHASTMSNLLSESATIVEESSEEDDDSSGSGSGSGSSGGSPVHSRQPSKHSSQGQTQLNNQSGTSISLQDLMKPSTTSGTAQQAQHSDMDNDEGSVEEFSDEETSQVDNEIQFQPIGGTNRTKQKQQKRKEQGEKGKNDGNEIVFAPLGASLQSSDATETTDSEDGDAGLHLKRPQKKPEPPLPDTKTAVEQKRKEFQALLERRKPRYYHKTVGCHEVCLVFLILISIVITAFFGYQTVADQIKMVGEIHFHYNNLDNHSVPTAAPTASPFILPDYTEQALSNANSEQARALEWLRSDPDFERYSLAEKYKRQGLYTLYATTGGSTWGDTVDIQMPETGYAMKSECDFPFYFCPNDTTITTADGTSTAIGTGTLPSKRRQLFTASFHRGATLSLTSTELSLRGTLPPEIGLLTDLQQVYISNHISLGGSIPSTIRFWGNYLMHLVMSNNALTGTIPHTIGQLQHLRTLWLSGNQLRGTLPATIAMATQLTSLQLFNNRLTGSLPVELRAYPYVHEVFLQNNQLTGPLPVFARPVDDQPQVTRLNQILLHNNQFTGTIHTLLGLLTDLEVLQLHSNSLIGRVPIQVCNLKTQHKLRLLTIDCLTVRCSCDCTCPTGGKPISADLLESLPEYTRDAIQNETRNTPDPTPQNMAYQWMEDDPAFNDYTVEQSQQRFVLAAFYYATNQPPDYDTWFESDNWLTYDNGGECSWQSTQSVLYRIQDPATDALFTCISGAETNQYADEEYYQVLKLPDNNLTGTLIPELSLLTNLKKIQLHSNPALTGEIPSELALLNKLEILDLEGAQLTGTIPIQLTDMPDLRRLYLGNNVLNGTLPTYLGQFVAAEHIQLNNNKYVGTVPSELGLLSNSLERLYLSANQLTGRLPVPQFAQLTSLIDLYLDDNAFIGDVGQQIPWTATGLEHLVISDNLFTSTIPTSIGGLTNAQVILLDTNDLRGPIPSEIGNLSRSLQWFHVDRNALTNTIPDEVGDLRQLVEFHAGFNQLTGTIPTRLASIPGLISLSLETNRLFDTLPTQLGSAASLSRLVLDHNDLIGTFPVEMARLSNTLTWLDLSWNALTGSLPDEIGSLGMLEYMYMERNNIRGAIPGSIGALSSLTELSLYGMQLTGTIPTELGLLSDKLTGVFLHENYIDGTIPTELGYLTNLESLWIHLLAITGTVPTEVCQLFETGSLQILAVDCLKITCTCGCRCPTEAETALQFDEVSINEDRSDKSGRTNHLGTVLIDPNFAEPVKKAHDSSTALPTETSMRNVFDHSGRGRQ